MTSIEELEKAYEAKDNAELLDLYKQFDDYSEDAKKAFFSVINRRGGIEVLKKEYETQEEIKRVIPMIRKHVTEQTSFANLMISIGDTTLDEEQINQLIQKEQNHRENVKNDTEIKGRTVIGSLFGIILGSIIGGTVWGVQLIYTGKIFLFMFFVLFAINYAFIHIFTSQSRNNLMVLVASIIGAVFSFVIGQTAFEIVGYLGESVP